MDIKNTLWKSMGVRLAIIKIAWDDWSNIIKKKEC